MDATEFLDALVSDSGDPIASLRQLEAMTAGEREELRGEVVRRLGAGTVPPNVAVAVLPVIGAEPAVPDLIRLLRSREAAMPVRAAALILLRFTTYDLHRELAELEPASMAAVVAEAIEMQTAADTEAQRGTPFERLAFADPDDDAVDIDEIVGELIESFCASPEAPAGDPDDLRFWAGELVRLGVEYGFQSPALWGPGDIEELLTDILPRKLTITSADEAKAAVPVFRAFFRWVSRVTATKNGEAIDEVLEEYEADFPSMMMDETRFGPAKSFLANGAAAGFDMTSEEGLHAFQDQWNREHARPLAGKPVRNKLDPAKKRKAKMAKLSRRKNRRKK